MTQPASCLRIVEDTADTDPNEISVKGQLRRVDPSAERTALKFFYNIHIVTGTSFPLYEILWRDIALTGLERGESLHTLLLFAGRLDSYFEDMSYQKIECIGLPRRYQLVVDDVADAHDIDVVDSSTTKAADAKSKLSTWFQNIKKTGFMIGDQVLSQFLRPFVQSSPSANFAFFPFSGREGSMIPVLKRFHEPVDVFRHAIAAAILCENDFLRTYAGRNAINFDHTSTIKTIGLELLFLFGLFREMFATRCLEQELIGRIEAEFEIELTRCVKYTVREVYKSNLRELLFGVVMQDVFDRSDHDVAVVGGMSVRDRAILSAARKNGMRTCYIPHSIGTYPDPLPRPGTIHFTAGDLDVKHYRSVYLSDHLPKFVPTGRPYLDDLRQEVEDSATEPTNSEKMTLTLATQPYGDSVRKGFLRDCLQAAASSSFDEVVVKIHPSESTAFYRDFLEELPKESIEIRVEAGDLLSNLLQSDLVITITSNVAIEAVIAGSPCVCYNPWHPMIPDQPYVTDGDIPSVTDFVGLRTYLNRDPDGLEALRETQQSFVYDGYRIDGGAADRIATHIEGLIDAERSV